MGTLKKEAEVKGEGEELGAREGGERDPINEQST